MCNQLKKLLGFFGGVGKYTLIPLYPYTLTGTSGHKRAQAGTSKTFLTTSKIALGYCRRQFSCLAMVIALLLQPFFLPVTAHAEDIITNRTGTIRITRPDRVVLTIGADEALPEIPSGSSGEVLDGSIDIAPTDGFIQVVVKDSVATVEVGSWITASVDPKTKMADFSVEVGEVNIITANTTTTVKAGQEVQIGLDKRSGKVSVKSIKGNIETVTAGVRAMILHGGFAQLGVDSQTRQIHIVCITGMIEATSLEGQRMIFARGESRDIQGSFAGEVLTFPSEVEMVRITPTEEPSEPEVPEASPYRP